MADIAEHRLDRGKALPVAGSAFRAVDLVFHSLGVRFGFVHDPSNEHPLSQRGALRMAQALVSERARPADSLGPGELHGVPALDHHLAAVLSSNFHLRREECDFLAHPGVVSHQPTDGRRDPASGYCKRKLAGCDQPVS